MFIPVHQVYHVCHMQCIIVFSAVASVVTSVLYGALIGAICELQRSAFLFYQDFLDDV